MGTHAIFGSYNENAKCAIKEKGRRKRMCEKETENKIEEGVHTHNIGDINRLLTEHDPQYAAIVKTTIKPKPNRILQFLKRK